MDLEYAVGDLIELRSERGIVVHVQPSIMRIDNVHTWTYVPIMTTPRVIQRAYEPNAQLANSGVIERVRAYIAKAQAENASVPTGCTTAPGD